MNIELLDFILVFTFIYFYLKINLLGSRGVVKYSLRVLTLLILSLSPLMITALVSHVSTSNILLAGVNIVLEIFLYFYLLGLLLLLVLGINEQYILYGLAHPISVATLYILSAMFFILHKNNYVSGNIGLDVLNLMRFLVMSVILFCIICGKRFKEILYISSDVLSVIAVSIFLVISFLIMAPSYLVYSEDIQTDIYTSVLLSEFGNYIKKHVISIYFTPFHLVLLHFTNRGFAVLPAVVLALLLLTPFQFLTMYFIIRNYLDNRKSFIVYLLVISGMSCVSIISILSDRNYFLPSPLSPLVPENFARYILRYKYFYTALLSAIATYQLFFSTQQKDISNIARSILFFLLGIASSLHPLVLIYVLIQEIVIAYLYIREVKFKTLLFNLTSYNAGIIFVLVTFADIKNALLGTTLIDTINISLRLSLVTHIISFVNNYHFLANIGGLIVVIALVSVIMIILVVLSTKNVKLQKIITNDWWSIALITLVLASLIVEVFNPQYYKQYEYFSKILPWRIGPYPSLMILSLAFPIISLMLLGTFRDARKRRQLVLLVLISVFSVLIVNLIDMGVFSYRFLVPMQISAAVVLVSFVINKENRVKENYRKNYRRVLTHMLFLSMILFFLIDPIVTFNSLLVHNYGAAELYDYYELYHIVYSYGKHAIVIANHIVPSLRLPRGLFSAIYYAKQPSYLKLASDINISFIIVKANSKLTNYPGYLRLRGLVNRTKNYYIIKWVYCDDNSRNFLNSTNVICVLDFFSFKNSNALIRSYNNFIEKCIHHNCIVLIAPFEMSLCKSGNITKIYKYTKEHTKAKLDNRYLALSKLISLIANNITVYADSIYRVQYFKNLSSVIIPVKVKFIGHDMSLHNVKVRIMPAISTHYVYLYIEGTNELYVLRNPIIIIHNYEGILKNFIPVTFNRIFYFNNLSISGRTAIIKYYYTLLYGWKSSLMVYYIKFIDNFITFFPTRTNYILLIKVNNCLTVIMMWGILFCCSLIIRILFKSLRNNLRGTKKQ